jgi:hypothetical protein
MSPEVARIFMKEHFVDHYTHPSCHERQQSTVKMYSPFKATCPECRLALTLRTKLKGIAVCHINQDVGHPNQEFFWLSRPVIPGGLLTRERFASAHERFRAKIDLGATPDWHLPTMRLPETPTSGLCWDDPTNVSFSAEKQFRARLAKYTDYEEQYNAYFKQQGALMFAPCNPKKEACADDTPAAKELAHRYDWGFSVSKKNVTNQQVVNGRLAAAAIPVLTGREGGSCSPFRKHGNAGTILLGGDCCMNQLLQFHKDKFPTGTSLSSRRRRTAVAATPTACAVLCGLLNAPLFTHRLKDNRCWCKTSHSRAAGANQNYTSGAACPLPMAAASRATTRTAGMPTISMPTSTVPVTAVP